MKRPPRQAEHNYGIVYGVFTPYRMTGDHLLRVLMRAYRFDDLKSLDRLRLLDKEMPKPQCGEVLIRVRAVSLILPRSRHPPWPVCPHLVES